MERFEQMRREYEHGVGTIKGVARKFGVHRRMVREAIGNAIPAPRKQPERDKPKLGAVSGWIDGILEADRKAPRKQRHTGASDLDPLEAGTARCRGGRVDGARVRAEAKDRAGAAARRSIHSAELSLSARRPCLSVQLLLADVHGAEATALPSDLAEHSTSIVSHTAPSLARRVA